MNSLCRMLKSMLQYKGTVDHFNLKNIVFIQRKYLGVCIAFRDNNVGVSIKLVMHHNAGGKMTLTAALSTSETQYKVSSGNYI